MLGCNYWIWQNAKVWLYLSNCWMKILSFVYPSAIFTWIFSRTSWVNEPPEIISPLCAVICCLTTLHLLTITLICSREKKKGAEKSGTCEGSSKYSRKGRRAGCCRDRRAPATQDFAQIGGRGSALFALRYPWIFLPAVSLWLRPDCWPYNKVYRLPAKRANVTLLKVVFIEIISLIESCVGADVM